MMMKLRFSLALLTLLMAVSVHAAQLNRQMKLESLEESMKINPEPEKSLVIVRSQIPNLKFESNRNIDRVHEVSSGYWEVWLPGGTHILKFDAEGFERLELPAKNYAKKRTYELRIVAVGFAPTARADEHLIEAVFLVNQDSVYSSYGEFAPVMAKTKTITYKLPKGEYAFTFRKEGYTDAIRHLTLTEPVTQSIDLQPGASSVRLSLPGMIHMTSDPSGAEIMVNGQRLGLTPYQGELPAGTYQLEARKLLYYPNLSEFSLKEGETKSLALTMKPRFGVLNVTTIPSGAHLMIDGKDAGEAPVSKREIESGPHVVKASMPMYDDATETMTVVDGDVKTLSLTLAPRFGSMTITSAPESAQVSIDGRMVGVTPFSAERLGAGKYIVKLVKPLYADAEEELTVEVGKTTMRTFALAQNFGTVTVNAPESEIFLNDAMVGHGTARLRLEPKRYLLRAERGDRYLPAEKEIFIRTGSADLVTLEPQPRQGSVSVIVTPEEASGAEILVNDEPKGKAPLVLPLLMGEYLITARAPNFLDAVRTIRVKEHESEKVTMELLTYEGSRDQVRSRWALAAWVSGGAAVAAGGAAAVFHAQSEKNFTNYQNASTAAAAASYRQKVSDNDRLYNISISVATAAVSSAVIGWIIHSLY